MATTGRASIDLKFKGLEQLRAGLERKRTALQHRGNAFHQAVIVTDRWVQKNFQTEGQMAYPGSGWKPLAQSTIEGK
jgi:hypothetical protein